MVGAVLSKNVRVLVLVIVLVSLRFSQTLNSVLGTAVAQCLRCCATNRKVAGSIPAGGFH